MQRKILITAALMGALAVIIGAWAAHGIQNFIPDADLLKLKKIESFKTGVRYQFYHTFLLLFLALIPNQYWHKRLNIVYALTVLGTLLFSGSIYLLSLKTQLGMASAAKVLGPITPIGGLTLIIGWAILFVYALKLKK